MNISNDMIQLDKVDIITTCQAEYDHKLNRFPDGKLKIIAKKFH